ncbi:MAG: 5-formyltetrahydrofolate cyclo-ligase [Gammaproteobacteria bacterium]
MTAADSLRASLRARRRAQPQTFREQAALAAAAALAGTSPGRNARRIAAFVAVDAELDPGPFIATAREAGRQVFLPVLGPRPGCLSFVRAEAGDRLEPNRYGIPEPRPGVTVDAQFLDLVLVPLLGFDETGNRLGMGAGYYDRTFEFRRGRRHWLGPLLIGFGYECQRIDTLPAMPWDVPLDGVVTEEGVQMFTRRR